MAGGFRLLRSAELTRQQLIIFALVSAILNGIVTAGVGAWLAQTYATQQTRRKSVEAIANLIYDRRTRARMAELHQFVLDCGATFTDELYKLTKLSFRPFSGALKERKKLAEINIKANCTRAAPVAPPTAAISPADALPIAAASPAAKP